MRSRPRLWQFTPTGHLRRLIRPVPRRFPEGPTALLATPAGGCYASIWSYVTVNRPPYYLNTQSLLRYDSTGTLLWRHDYPAVVGAYMDVLAPSVRGTILLAGTAPSSASLNYYPKLIEVEPSRGDSVNGAFLTRPPGPVTETMSADNTAPYNLLPLTNGQGYALTTEVQPNNGSTPAQTGAVVRLDANYTVRWRYQYPLNTPNSNDEVFFSQVRELADGSLLALARPRRTRQRIAWLYRLDGGTGAVLAVYPIRPQLPAQARLDYLLPVAADSTLLLLGVAATNTEAAAGLYVARVRIPGLPRIVSSRGPGAGKKALRLLCYPNPAREQLRVTYQLDRPAAARVEVRDLLGRVVRQVALPVYPGREVEVPVRGLAAGLYLVALVVDGQTLATQRVAIQD